MSIAIKFNEILSALPVYQPGRPIDEVARELGIAAADIIKLASNENPLGPSPKAMAAAQKALAQCHLYPDGSAYYLKQRLSQKLGVEPENIVLGNGSNEVLELVGHALLKPGVEAVMAQYCFVVYPIVTKLMGAETVVVPAKNYGHDLPGMLKAITPRTRVVFVANPNNPTGTLAPRADLLRLINEAPPHVLVVLDEAYLEYLDDPVDALAFVRNGTRPNLLLVRTFSKIYGLAGLRIGYGIGNPEVIAALEKVREPFNTSSVAQAAALAALDDDEHLLASRKNNQAGMKYFEKELKNLRIEFVPSRANFILVKVGDGQKVFMAMQKLGVIVRPVAGYQLPEWVRISIGTPAENERCLKALKQVMAK